MIAYFSGTGNTRFIAYRLAQLMGEELCEVLALREEDFARGGERLGLVFPIYAWGIPQHVVDRMEHLLERVRPCYDYVFALCTCGDEAGYADKQTEELFSTAGWRLDAFATLVMPETYVVLPGFKLDDSLREEKKISEATQKLEVLAKRFLQRSDFIDLVRGPLPWLKSNVLRPFFLHCLVKPTYFKLSDACVSCGRCAKVCPTNNISYDEQGYPLWGDDCTGCLACYHHCPTNAINYLFSKGKGQYRAV